MQDIAKENGKSVQLQLKGWVVMHRPGHENGALLRAHHARLVCRLQLLW